MTMLIEQMTPQEMIDELHKDYDELRAINMRFLTTGGIKHLRRQGTKFPAFVTKEQRTKRGNRYMCIFQFRKRGDVFNLDGLETRIALLQTKEGLAGVSLAYSGKYQQEVVYLYRPHMFKRYKERMGLNLEGIDLIRYFEKRNIDSIIHDDYQHKEGDIENDFMMTVYDGALFGTKREVDGRICEVINTFIANDTMQEGYKSQFNSKHDQAVDNIENELEFFGCKDDYIYAHPKKRNQ